MITLCLKSTILWCVCVCLRSFRVHAPILPLCPDFICNSSKCIQSGRDNNGGIPLLLCHVSTGPQTHDGIEKIKQTTVICKRHLHITVGGKCAINHSFIHSFLASHLILLYNTSRVAPRAKTFSAAAHVNECRKRGEATLDKQQCRVNDWITHI